MRPRRSSLALTVVAALVVAAAASGCRSCGEPQAGDDASAPPGSGTSQVPEAPPAMVVADLVSMLPSCDIDHRGLLVDLGTEALVGRVAWVHRLSERVTNIEHDGSTWSRVATRRLDLELVLPAAAQVYVAARVLGGISRTASVKIDDQPLGTLSLAKDQIKVATSPTTTLPLDAGLHVISLQMSGRAGDPDDWFADLDWIRVATPDDSTEAYGAPTLRDVVAPAAALGGVPHRSIALRAPGAVRCAAMPSPHARLRLAAGLLGAGEGDAEVRVLRDGKEPVLLQRVHLVGGDKAGWTDIDLPLDPFAGAVATIELRVANAPRGARVLFGDPAVVMPGVVPAPAAPARAAIVVVLDGVERDQLPPWSPTPTPNLPTLVNLAASGATFDRHRGASTVVAAAVASLLTGLPPRGHTVVDPNARLPASVSTLASMAREASVRAGFFTGVPATFHPYGFDAAWQKFVEVAPNSGEPATAPIDAAATWIAEASRDEGTRLLAIIHARGAHPPWDITAKELAAIPPADYTGTIEPRRAAQALAKLRRRRVRALAPDDRKRVRALEALALAGQDRAVGALVAALRTSGMWDSTLFVVTADVASGSSDAALYGDGLDLRESLLTLPLYVHFPGGALAGVRIDAPTEAYDVTRTVLGAIGVPPRKGVLGRDLGGVASGQLPRWPEPQIAMIGDRYSARWGDVVLSGRLDQPPLVCDLVLDPTCAFDRRDTMPLTLQAAWRREVAFESATLAATDKREPATIDADMGATLSVWGE